MHERGVRRVLAAVERRTYDRIYGAFCSLPESAERIVASSLERYVAWLRGDVPDEPDR